MAEASWGSQRFDAPLQPPVTAHGPCGRVHHLLWIGDGAPQLRAPNPQANVAVFARFLLAAAASNPIPKRAIVPGSGTELVGFTTSPSN